MWTVRASDGVEKRQSYSWCIAINGDTWNCFAWRERWCEAPAVAGIMQRDGYIPDNRDAAETAAFFSKEVDLMADAVAAAGIKPN